jgi:predicted ester cyclase
MGTAYRVAEQTTAALEAQDFGAVRAQLANDFVFDDPTTPAPAMNAEEWLAASQGLSQAFPDFTYNFEIVREEGNQVWVSSQWEGTHQGDWDLSIMGLGVIPATGRRVSTGRSMTRGTVNAKGKIQRTEVVEGGADAGLPAILQQLGVEVG